MEETMKTYITDITEEEKKVINLMRTYIAPKGVMGDFLDNIATKIIADDLIENTIRYRAFIEVMEDKRLKDKTPVELMSIINTYIKYIEEDDEQMGRIVNSVFGDIIEVMEGDIKPITSTITPTSIFAEEEAMLDKYGNL